MNNPTAFRSFGSRAGRHGLVTGPASFLMAGLLAATCLQATQPSPPRVRLDATFKGGVTMLSVTNDEQGPLTIELRPGAYSTVQFPKVSVVLDPGRTSLAVLDVKLDDGRQVLHVHGDVFDGKQLNPVPLQLHKPIIVSAGNVKNVSFEEAFLSRRKAIEGPSEKAQIPMGQGYVDSRPIVPLSFTPNLVPAGITVEEDDFSPMEELLRLKPGSLPKISDSVPGDFDKQENLAREHGRRAPRQEIDAAAGNRESHGRVTITGVWALQYSSTAYRGGWGFTVRLWQNVGGWRFLGSTMVGFGGYWTMFPDSRMVPGVPVHIEYLSQNRFVSFLDPTGNVFAWGHDVSVPDGYTNIGTWFGDLTVNGQLPGLDPILYGSNSLWSKFSGYRISPLLPAPIQVYYPNSLASGRCISGPSTAPYAWSCAYPGQIYLIPAHAIDTVVQHEIAHNIHRQYWGGLPPGSGGPHSLWGCYNPGLALTEGFANFVAFWVQHYSDDTDPRVAYLSYSIESPVGACPGQSNETWVSAALWDLFDYWNDGPDPAHEDSLSFTSPGSTPAVFLGAPRWSLADMLGVYQWGQPRDVQDRMAASFRLNTIIP